MAQRCHHGHLCSYRGQWRHGYHHEHDQRQCRRRHLLAQRRFGGQLETGGQTIAFVGRLLLMNPIGLLVTAIGLAAPDHLPLLGTDKGPSRLLPRAKRGLGAGCCRASCLRLRRWPTPSAHSKTDMGRHQQRPRLCFGKWMTNLLTPYQNHPARAGWGNQRGQAVRAVAGRPGQIIHSGDRRLHPIWLRL